MTDASNETPIPAAAVAESMREPLREYAKQVQDLAGDNLLGLTAFGPVVEEGFDDKRLPAASVMVLKRMDLGLLRRLAEQGAKLGRRGVSAPLVMTPEYIAGSLDTFPLELLEIAQRRVTLAGEDRFADLTFQPEHVRLQCERELKRILIRLRQGLLTAAGHDRSLGELELDVGLHLLRTLRGLLWLRGVKDWLPRGQVVAECERVVGGTLAGARRAIEPSGEHGWTEFTALYGDVERLAVGVDERRMANSE